VDVVIVGAGFSGTMLAVHLARETRVPASVTVVERTGRFGAGVAYSTPFASHLLNVPAARMSAFPDDPGHFARWAMAGDPAARPEAFLPRQLYSAYLGHLLDEASAHAGNGSRVRRLDAEVVAVAPAAGGWQVACADGHTLRADVVVLAIGNYPPADPPCATPGFYDSALYRQDPWAADALTVEADQDVLLVGTGLTMVDVAIALDEQGHRGTLTCVSRRGLLPQWLREPGNARELPPPSFADGGRTARGLLRAVRRAVADREASGGTWREVLGSLRSVTPSLWTSLPEAERRRFLRHLRPYWDTHRHGAAPAIGRAIDRLRDGGRLRVRAGRILRYDVSGSVALATVRERGSTRTSVVRAHRVINCTGPDADLRRVTSPLVRDLRDRGMMRPDPLGIGIVTDASGRVVDGSGAPQAGLYLAGPLRRGESWEHIAVPELREGAARLARHLVAAMVGTPSS
jgi:uncharacterized NAD(P)/FAD-binding protein YdhS